MRVRCSAFKVRQGRVPMLSGKALLAGGLCLFCIVSGSPEAAGGDPEFLRGDSNADGRVSISDALMSRRFLFNGELTPPCLQAADVDDNDTVDVTDVVRFINALFLGGPEPPAPFPQIGPDPTPSGASCEEYQVESPPETTDLVKIGDI